MCRQCDGHGAVVPARMAWPNREDDSRHWVRRRRCPIEEDPGVLARSLPDLLVVWPAADCDPLERDADAPEGVTIAYGSLRSPCGARLATVAISVYDRDPGPTVDCRHAMGRWFRIELLD